MPDNTTSTPLVLRPIEPVTEQDKSIYKQIMSDSAKPDDEITQEDISLAKQKHTDAVNADMKKFGAEAFPDFESIDYNKYDETSRSYQLGAANKWLSDLGKKYPSLSAVKPFESLEDVKVRSNEVAKMAQDINDQKSVSGWNKKARETASIFGVKIPEIKNISELSSAKKKAEKALEKYNTGIAIANQSYGAIEKIPGGSEWVKWAKDASQKTGIEIPKIDTPQQLNAAIKTFGEKVQQYNAEHPEKVVEKAPNYRGDIQAPNLKTDAGVQYAEKQQKALFERNQKMKDLLSYTPVSDPSIGKLLTDQDIAVLNSKAPESKGASGSIEGYMHYMMPMASIFGGTGEKPKDTEEEAYYKKNSEYLSNRSIEMQKKASSMMPEYLSLQRKYDSGQATKEDVYRMKSLSSDIQKLNDVSSLLHGESAKNAIDLSSFLSNQGNIAKGSIKAIGDLVWEAESGAAKLITSVIPNFIMNPEEKKEYRRSLDDVKRNMSKAIGVSEEYMASGDKSVLFGVEKILPYMLTAEFTVPIMAIQSYDAQREALEDNNNLSETEKDLIASLKGIASAAVMHYLPKLAKGETFINSLVYNAIESGAAKAGLSVASAQIEKQIFKAASSYTSAAISFPVITAAAGLSEKSIDDITNLIKGGSKGFDIKESDGVYTVYDKSGKPLIETQDKQQAIDYAQPLPTKSWRNEFGGIVSDLTKNAANDFKIGLVTGIIGNAVQTIQKNSFDKESFNNAYRMVSNKESFITMQNQIRQDLADKKITVSEAKEKMKALINFKNVVSKIPDFSGDYNQRFASQMEYAISKIKEKVSSGEMTNEKGREAIDNIRYNFKKILSYNSANKSRAFEAYKLITENDNLEREKAGYHEALRAPIQKRIDANNERIKEIGLSNDQEYQHKKEGGSTFMNGINMMGQEASSVSLFPERTQILDADPTQKDIDAFTERNKDLLEGNEDILSVGTWRDKEGKTYLDISAVVPHEEAKIIGKKYNQKAVFNLEKKKEVETGGTGEVVEGLGTEKERVREIRKTLQQTESKMENFKPMGIEDIKASHPELADVTTRAHEAVKSLFPNIEVRFHDSNESMQIALEKGNANTDASITPGNFSYVPDGKGGYDITIDLNLEAGASEETIRHEFGHAALLSEFGENPDMFSKMKRSIRSFGLKLGDKELIDFSNRYDKSQRPEEYLVELAARSKDIQPGTLAKIAEFINNVVSNVTGGKFQPFKNVSDTNESVRYFDSMMRAIRSGEKIEPSEREKPEPEGEIKSKAQAEKLLTKKKEKFKSLKELASWLQDWSAKNKIIKTSIDSESDKTIVSALAKHTLKELEAWDKVSQDYVGFYDEDIPNILNNELVDWAKQKYNKNLTKHEISLYHVLSSFASPSATPVFDSNIGLQIFDRYLKTGRISAYSDTKQATVWETDKNGRRYDTGDLKYDKDGNPVMSQIARAYAVDSLDKFMQIVDHFEGNIEKSIDWIESTHSYKEMSDMFNMPTTGQKSLGEHENLSRQYGGFGVFAISGPKLGSYILNRVGEYGTVTKDLWYARTMARLFGEPLIDKKGEVLKEPWALTKAGIRKRKLADEAWTKVGNKLGIKPAIVQQRMWDFEKKLWQSLGAESSAPGWASEGLRKGIEVTSKQSLITDKKMVKQMTEDEDGNYLFYHYSPGKITGGIDPRRFGQNLKTGRDERPGIGISMYYTRPDYRDVGGNYGYVVRIPKDKVYPFNSDPLDLYDKAEAEFQKMYPGQAFDANKQVAFISQEAAKLGYKMTVAKWGDNLRAQTTEKLKPEWYEKPHPEYRYSPVYNPKIEPFVANENKRKSKQSLSDVEKRKLIIEPKDRTSWKSYNVGDIIDGDKLDELSGKTVGNKPDDKFVLVQTPLSEFTDNRNELLSLEKDYQQEEVDRLESMKSNFEKTPPIPDEGDGMHRIISAKELGHKTILQWKNINDVIGQPKSKQRLQPGDKTNIQGIDVTIPDKKEQDVLTTKRTKKKYFDKEVESMKPSSLSKEELKAILDRDDIAILTGTNPDGNPIDDNTNKLLNEKAEEWLQKKNYKYYKVTGKYGQTESSFLVKGMTGAKALEFAKDFKQDSVAHSEGLIYRDNTIEKRDVKDDAFDIDVTDPRADYVSAIKTKDGSVLGFKIGIDFNERVEYEPKSKQSLSEKVIKDEDIDRLLSYQSDRMNRGEILDNDGNEIYTPNTGIGSNGLETLTSKKWGHGSDRKSEKESLKIINDILGGGKFKSGDFGKVGGGSYGAIENGKFTIVTDNPKSITETGDVNPREVEIILNDRLSAFGQQLKNNHPEFTIKDYNGNEFKSQPKSKQSLSEKDIRKNMDEMMDKYSKKMKGRPVEEIVNKVINDVQGPWVKDSQSEFEAAVRSFKEDNGIKVPKAPSAKKIAGEKPKMVTVNEMAALKDQIRLEAKAAKDSAKSVNDAKKAIGEKVKEMAGAGEVSAKQAAIISDRLAKVNIDNEDSVNRFLSYAEKVFNDAEYGDKLKNANTRRKQISSKQGSETLPLAVRNMVSLFKKINPSAVEDIDKYNEMAELVWNAVKPGMVKENSDGSITDASKKAARISDIIEYVESQESAFEEAKKKSEPKEDSPLEIEYYENKIAELSDTAKQMMADGIDPATGERVDIPQADKDIVEAFMNMKPKDKATLKAMAEALDHFIVNQDTGLMPYVTEKYKTEKRAEKAVEVMKNVISGKKAMIENAMAKIRSGMKGLFSRNGKSDVEHARQYLYHTSTRFVDDMLRNFSKDKVFNHTMKAMARGYELFRSDVRTMDSSRIAQKLLKDLGSNKRKFAIAKYKITMYLRQLEHESNPGSSKSLPALDYIKETISASSKNKNGINEYSRKILESMIDPNDSSSFVTTDENGNLKIDKDKIWNSMSEGEKEAVQKLRELYTKLLPFAKDVSIRVRNNPFPEINNYTAISATGRENMPSDLASEMSSYSDMVNNVSTRAGHLEERTGKAGSISMDPFETANKAVRDIMLDYHMTTPMRTLNQIMKGIETEFENSPREVKDLAYALKDIFKEVNDAVLARSFHENTFWGDVVDLVTKKYVYNTLVTIERITAELGSNIGFNVIMAPEQMAEGVKHGSVFMNEAGGRVLYNMGSLVTDRLYPHGTDYGRFDSPEAYDIKLSRSQNVPGEAISRLQAVTEIGRRASKMGEKTGDVTITAPDLLSGRTLWFGSMAMEFKKITGQEIDFDKISEKDPEYMKQYGDAIDQARDKTDELVINSISTKNPYMISPDQATASKGGKIAGQITSLLAGFSRMEYDVARNAITQAYNSGDISKAQAAKMMAAVTVRAALYYAVKKKVNSAIITGASIAAATAMSMMSGKKDEKDELEKAIEESPVGSTIKEKEAYILGTRSPKIPGVDTSIILDNRMMSVDQRVMEQLRNAQSASESGFMEDLAKGAGTGALSLLLGRNFNNPIKSYLIAPAYEYAHMKYVGEDKYNRYKDAHLYSNLPIGSDRYIDWIQGIVKGGGAPGQVASGGIELLKNWFEGYHSDMNRIKQLKKMKKAMDAGEDVPASYRNKTTEDIDNEIALVSKNAEKSEKEYLYPLIVGAAASTSAIPFLKDLSAIAKKQAKDVAVKTSDWNELLNNYRKLKITPSGTIFTGANKDKRLPGQTKEYKYEKEGLKHVGGVWINMKTK